MQAGSRELRIYLCIFIAQKPGPGQLVVMNPVIRIQLVNSVATELRRRLIQGELKGQLPGARLLAKALGVSVPTVCKALHQLHQEGFLTGGGDRKRWQTADLTQTGLKGALPAKRPATRPGRLLYVSTLPLSIERQTGVEVFAKILDLLGAKGWEVMYRAVPLVNARKPHRAWDDLLRFARPDALVVQGGSEVFGTWAVQNRLRTLFVGGEPGKSQLPMIMVRASIMLRQALERLFATGHRRILIPLCGRIPQFAENCRRQTREYALELGVDPEAVVFAESEYSSPELLAGAMRQHWRRYAPDALIIFDWREYLAASSFLKEASIAIPRDVSVVLLSHNPTMEWHLPTLCHFMHPVEEIARVCAKWVAGGKPMLGNGEVMEFRSKWVEGASIANRTKKARPE